MREHRSGWGWRRRGHFQKHASRMCHWRSPRPPLTAKSSSELSKERERWRRLRSDEGFCGQWLRSGREDFNTIQREKESETSWFFGTTKLPLKCLRNHVNTLLYLYVAFCLELQGANLVIGFALRKLSRGVIWYEEAGPNGESVNPSNGMGWKRVFL